MNKCRLEMEGAKSSSRWETDMLTLICLHVDIGRWNVDFFFFFLYTSHMNNNESYVRKIKLNLENRVLMKD